MKIEILPGDRQLTFIILLIATIVAISAATAYNAVPGPGLPATMGHSVDEMDWTQKIPGAVSATGDICTDQGGGICLSTAGGGVAFGAWQDVTAAAGGAAGGIVNGPAATDGILVAGSAGATAGVNIYTGANAGALFRVSHENSHGAVSITTPVKQGEFWRITLVNGILNQAYWIPLIAGGGGGGGGDITGVIAGIGLTDGGMSGDVTLNTDTTYLQRRVTGSCVGQVMVGINANGTAVCEADDTVVGGNSLWTAAGADIFFNAGKVGIGTATPNEILEVLSSSDDPPIYAEYTGAAPRTAILAKGVRAGEDYIGQVGASNFLAGLYGQTFAPNGFGVIGVGQIGVQGNGLTYDFYANGLGTNYGPFTGAHEVKLGPGFPSEGRQGMLVYTTGQVEKREMSISSTLPTVELADTTKNSRVLGVFVKEADLPEGHWYESGEGERFGIVNALGEGLVWVTNFNGEAKNGDFVTSSPITGQGMRQDDDLLHSYTVAKLTEEIEWDLVNETIEYNGEDYKVYLAACTYKTG